MDVDRIEELAEELIRERSMEALERLTGSKDDRVLAALIDAAGDIIDAETPQDEDDTILEDIQAHLVKSAEVGPLIDALNSESSSIREFALGCLGEMGDITAAEPMIDRLADKEASVREAAAEHLSLLTDQDLGEDPAAWRQWLTEQAELAKVREADEREESKQRAKAKTKVLDVKIDEDEEESEGDDDDDRPRKRRDDDDEDSDSDDDDRRRRSDDDDF
jgi:hypothetical protein